MQALNPASSVSSRDHVADATKGFLILCIVLEHNSLLTIQYDWIRPYTDAFAAGCFLLLSFLRPIKKLPVHQFVANYYRYYIPFIFFVLITSIANAVLFKNSNPGTFISDLSKAIFIASPSDLKNATGFSYLWFLPCLCFLYLFRLIHEKVGSSFIALPIVTLLFVGFIDEETLAKVPFSIHAIGFLYCLGLILSKLHKPIITSKSWIKTLVILVFFFLSYLSIVIGWKLFLAAGRIPSIEQPELILFYASLMIITIPSLYIIFAFLPGFITRSFSVIGKYSLKIYLIHPLVYFLITSVLKLTDSPAASFVYTIIITLGASVILSKINFVEMALFPKTLNYKRKMS